MQNPTHSTGQLDWNDLRYILAVARSGSTLSASRLLRVSQSTVSRRIDVAEAALEVSLFDRRRSGYVLTDAGSALMAQAEIAEAACKAFEREALSVARGLSGTVRLTANEMTFNAHLDRALAELRGLYPALRIETISDERLLDLSNGEADVAIRGGARPTEPTLHGRLLTLDPWSVYGSPDYLARNGMPGCMQDTTGHLFVALHHGRVEPQVVDQIDAFLEARDIAVRRDSMTGMLSAMRSSVGLGVMSDFVARADPGLVRCFSVHQPQTPEIWLLTHARLRNEPKVRLVMDFLAGYFSTRLRAVPSAER